MEFAFKNILPVEFLGCRLCKAIYFRPDRKDLLENHLKFEHKIDFDESDFREKTPKNCKLDVNLVNQQSVIEPLPPIPVNSAVVNGCKIDRIPKENSGTNLQTVHVSAKILKKKRNLKRRASTSFR